MIEFQDSREYGSEFPNTLGNSDQTDLIQAYVEWFDAKRIDGRPMRIQIGRLTMNYGRGRLVARNGFRNTTNAFDGIRLQLGDKKSKFSLDLFATQPVERFVQQFDHGDDERLFVGAMGAWRPKEGLTIEPYYLYLGTNRKAIDRPDSRLHTIGAHAFGAMACKDMDFDVEGAFQFGNNRGTRHRAAAIHLELGYTFTSHPWKPRIAVQYDYATGDKSPTDSSNQGFNDLFEKRRAQFGVLSYFSWRNINSPAILATFRPTKKVKGEFRYRAAWLARTRDSWNRGVVRDVTGSSGDFIGQEIDIRVRTAFTENFEVMVGYSKFLPGDYLDNADPRDETDFFYVQSTIRF